MSQLKTERYASPLLTDLYQLTMLKAYFDRGLNDTAVFEFFVRDLPDHRGFLLAAGLEQVVDYLEHFRFDEQDLHWIANSEHFSQEFADYLGRMRFTGDVHAMREGTPFFADEPIIRVTGPLPEVQLVESRLINLVHYQTLIASKAARCVLAAPDKLLVDFGMRRAHGAEAGLFAARASYLAGFAGSATVLANEFYGLPVFGTMSHAYVEAHPSEAQAFEHFAESNPNNVVLLIDTYDTEDGARTVVDLAPRLAEKGISVKAVRIDSGDLLEHARWVRAILDEGGLPDTHIFASGGIDEETLRSLLEAGAPIDGFGVGTRLDTSADAPYLDCAYKIEEFAGEPRRKSSEGKATWPGRKQVFRQFDGETMARDTLALEDDEQPGQALLEQVMAGGRRTAPPPGLDAVRAHAQDQLSRLPDHLRSLDATPAYPVEVAPGLRELAAKLDRQSH